MASCSSNAESEIQGDWHLKELWTQRFQSLCPHLASKIYRHGASSTDCLKIDEWEAQLASFYEPVGVCQWDHCNGNFWETQGS